MISGQKNGPGSSLKGALLLSQELEQEPVEQGIVFAATLVMAMENGKINIGVLEKCILEGEEFGLDDRMLEIMVESIRSDLLAKKLASILGSMPEITNLD